MEDEESDDFENGHSEPDSNPVFCLSSRLKSKTVAITRNTSLRLSVGVEKYPTTRFLIKYLQLKISKLNFFAGRNVGVGMKVSSFSTLFVI